MSGLQEVAERVIRALLRLTPRWFRQRYGAEMLGTFRDGWNDARPRGRGAVSLYCLRTMSNLLSSAVRLRVEREEGDADVRRAARVTNGPPAITATRGGGFMDRLAQDLRFAFRYLRRNPLFTVTVLATLALGIGMNTAAFSVLYGVVHQPLPYAHPDEVVQVGRLHPDIPNALLPLSPANYLDVRSRVQRVVQLEAETGTGYVLTGRGDAARHPGSRVSAGFFDLFGVAPALGRTFREGEDQAGAEKVVVVSDGFWRTQLGADEAIVGQTIRLNDTPHTVVGVMPPIFQFSGALLWVPIEWTEQVRAVRGNNFLRMYARLAPGATVAHAAEELAAIWAPLRAEFPAGNEGTELAVEKLQEVIARRSRTGLLIVSGAAALLLLIACANVANLTLVRAEYRQRETGVRAALGAEPRRIARQFITESLLLGVLGGAIGLWVAHAGVRALLAAFDRAIPRAHEIGIHAPVLVFTLVVSLATGLLVGLFPVVRARGQFDALRAGGRSGTVRTTTLGKGLVVAEIALALMLVTGAGLLLKSYDRATHSELGFRAGEVVAANLWFPASRYTDTPPAAAFMEQLLPLIEARPEIAGAALSSMVPLREFGNNWTEMGVLGRPDAKASFVESRSMTPDLFETLGMRLLGGRVPTEAEARDGAPVAVINRTLARQLFGDENPLGQQLATGDSWQREIIGVVSDLRDFGPDQQPRPTIYQPTTFTSTILLRTTASVGAVAEIVRAAIRNIDPNVQLVRIQHMDEIVDTALSGRRFQLTLIGVFAITALLLACIGIYGVLSYTVSRQTRDIGVRIALGARASGVAGLIALWGGQLALAGVTIGLVGAVAIRRVIASQLFEVGSLDPAVYVGVTFVLLAVAAAASFLPARRAATVDPMQALRAE